MVFFSFKNLGLTWVYYMYYYGIDVLSLELDYVNTCQYMSKGGFQRDSINTTPGLLPVC